MNHKADSTNDSSVYSKAVRGGTKISDSPPKIVSDLVTATLHQFD